jgi:sulfoxide reductase heme-binding subunit YedZ
MTRRTRRGAKVLVILSALVPLALLLRAFVTGELLLTEPVKNIQHRTGIAALILLLLTLAVTPLRRLTGWNEIIRFRRMLGVFAFFYAALHAFSYFVFDQELSPSAILVDIAEHPWVLLGFTAFTLLTPLAVTSTAGWVRRLGGRRWRALHQLVYVAAGAAVLHFLWLVKLDVREPVFYAVALVALLSIRLVYLRRDRRARLDRNPSVSPPRDTARASAPGMP